MPEKMASHWDASGRVDGYMPKGWGLFLMPVMLAGLYLFFLFLPNLDSLKKNIEAFRKYFDVFILLLFCFLLAVYVVSLLWNLGLRFNIGYVIMPAVSALFYYCGIFLEHTKRNWLIGLRTPWTLNSDNVWEKTHRAGGKIFRWYALFMLACTVMIKIFPAIMFWAVIVPAAGILIWMCEYSYIEYKKEQGGN